MSKNYWRAYRHDIAAWTITLPLPTTMRDAERILEFVKAFLDLGEQEAVIHIQEIKGEFIERPGWRYIDHLAQMLREDKVLKPFDVLYRSLPQGNVRMPARLAYFDPSGQIVEDNVENVGALIQQLEPERADLV